MVAMYVFCPLLPTRSNTNCKRLSACVRDTEPLRFTKYSNECCQVLQDTSEFPADAFLVHLVRSMHLADKINRTFVIFGQAIVALFRLCLYQTDNGEWDRAYVQSTIDFNQAVDEVGWKLEEHDHLRGRAWSVLRYTKEWKTGCT